MAENAAHLAIVESSPDAAAYTEIDGVKSFSKEQTRDSLDKTNMKDPSAHKLRAMGLKDSRSTIEGDVALTAVTFVIDAGQKNLIESARDGGLVALRTKLNGSGGTYIVLASALVSGLRVSATVDGLVSFSCDVQANGSVWT